MARKEADLSTFTMASDYNPAHYKNWEEKELAALGNCKATAEAIKKRLEANGAKVKEMYAVEHKGEKKGHPQPEKCHNVIDKTKLHYHILVKFEPTHGATLEEIAKFIGVPPQIIEKPEPGRYSYDNMLSYLTHIKDESKIRYAPEDVITLVGTDYMDYFNERKERWLRARNIKAKKGGKPLNRLLREAMAKMKAGEIAYSELRGIKEYRRLLFEPKYARQLERKNQCIVGVAKQDYDALAAIIKREEITSLDEIVANKDWDLARKYHDSEIIKSLAEPISEMIMKNALGKH